MASHYVPSTLFPNILIFFQGLPILLSQKPGSPWTQLHSPWQWRLFLILHPMYLEIPVLCLCFQTTNKSSLGQRENLLVDHATCKTTLILPCSFHSYMPHSLRLAHKYASSTNFLRLCILLGTFSPIAKHTFSAQERFAKWMTVRRGIWSRVQGEFQVSCGGSLLSSSPHTDQI